MKNEPAISRQFPDSSRVLVVEDDAVARLILACWFDRWGVSYDMFTNSEAVMKRLDRNPYQLAVVDFHLPGKNGLALIRAMRDAAQRYQYTLPTFVIHSTDTDVRALAAREEVNAFLAKPVPPDVLRATLVRAGCRVKDEADTSATRHETLRRHSLSAEY